MMTLSSKKCQEKLYRPCYYITDGRDKEDELSQLTMYNVQLTIKECALRALILKICAAARF